MDPLITRLVYLGDALARSPSRYAALIDRALPTHQPLASHLKAAFREEFDVHADGEPRDRLRGVAVRLSSSDDPQQRLAGDALYRSLSRTA